MDDLFFLTTEVLYSQDKHKYGAFHKWMCDTVSKTGSFRELWLLPRDHFKTTILTVAHLVQQVLRDPGGSFLFLSGKDEHALLMSDEARRHFVFNERMRAIFPPWCAATEDAMGSKSEWTSPAKAYFGQKRREPTLTATGFKSRLESKHYKGAYLDDCMGEDDTSEVGLAEARENFKKVIPLVDRDGFVIMPGTRKHYNDLYQGVMDTGAYKVRVRHGLEHADKLCDQDECTRFAEPHKAPDFKTGVPLSVERMDRAAYEQKLRECEIDPKRGQSYFWHEYMNIPFSPTDRVFQPSWFVRVQDEMIPGRHEPFPPLTKWIAVDTAWKDDEHPTGFDFTVIVVGGFDDHGRLYVLDLLRDRNWTMKQGVEAIVTAMRAYGISRVITEKVGEVTWHNFLKDRCRVVGTPLQLLALTRGGRNQKSKIERIRGLQGYFEQGKVYFRKSCENYDDAINEFCNLGRWTNDDIADAISMFYDERVIVRPELRDNTKGPVSLYKPMPFDGPWRRTAYQSTVAPQAQSKGETFTIGMTGDFALPPRETPRDEPVKAFFRPLTR